MEQGPDAAKWPGAVVCAGQHGVNALATIRSIGRRGIPVHVVNLRGSAPTAARSRYCARHSQATHMETLVDTLRLAAQPAGSRPVLFVDNDRMMRALQPHAAELETLFRVVDPISQALELTDKRLQASTAVALGIDIPKTCMPSTWREIGEFGAEVAGRLIAKPVDHASAPSRKFKTVIAVDAVHLIRELQKHEVEPGDLVVQEYIEGDDCEVYVALCYRDRNGTSHVFTARKLRQAPLGAGVMSMGQSVDVAEVRSMTVALADRLRLRGVISTEFKYSRSTGRFYFVEWNPRPGAFQSLAWKSGFDLAYLGYCDHVGMECSARVDYSAGQVWINAESEIENIARNPRLALKGDTWRALLGRKEFAVLSWDDLEPFRAASASFARDLTARALRKVTGLAWRLG